MALVSISDGELKVKQTDLRFRLRSRASEAVVTPCPSVHSNFFMETYHLTDMGS